MSVLSLNNVKKSYKLGDGSEFPVLKGIDIKDATGKIIIPGVKVDSSTPIKKAIVQTTFADANQ